MKILFVQKSKLGRYEMAAGYYFPVELARLGHDVMVVAQAGGDASAYLNAGVKVAEIEAGASWLGGLRRFALSFRPEIVHVFIHAGCGLYPLVMRFGRSAPKFVLDIRSPLLRTGLLRKIVQIKNRLEIVGYDSVFTHSIESGYTVIGKSGKTILAPPGIDFSILPKLMGAKSEHDGAVKLVYVGSIDIKRQLDQMIRAVELARQHVPLTLDLYGDGNAVAGLQELVNSAGMQEYVHFKGKIDRRSLFEIIVSYHAGLSYIPRELYNAAPALKTLEYLACGIPVVATNTDGNRMFVQDGKNGMLTEWTPEAFADGIIRLAGSDVRSASPGELRSGVAEYDWGNIVEKRLMPAYSELLADASLTS